MATAPRLPDLARRLVTVSLRINAAQTVARSFEENARRTLLRALNAEAYNRVRQTLLAWVLNHSGSMFTAHHYPGGGGAPKDDQLEESHALKEPDFLSRVCDLQVTLPAYHWAEDGSRVGWDAPPIRALAMADGFACDLSTSFQLFILDLEKSVQHNVAEFYLPVSHAEHIPASNRAQISSFRHDYLWFNSVALFDSLKRLFQGYWDEVKKVEEPVSPRWKCIVREYLGPQLVSQPTEFTGLQIELVQIVRSHVTFGPTRLPGAEILVPPYKELSGLLPSSESSPHKFCSLVSNLRSAGAHIGMHKGLLEILIPARNILDIQFSGVSAAPIWRVDTESTPAQIWNLWLKKETREDSLIPAECVSGPEPSDSQSPIVRLSRETVITIIDLQFPRAVTEYEVPTADNVRRHLVLIPDIRPETALIMLHGKDDGDVGHEKIREALESGKVIIEITLGLSTRYPTLRLPLLTNASRDDRLIKMNWEKFELEYVGNVLDFVRNLRGH